MIIIMPQCIMMAESTKPANNTKYGLSFGSLEAELHPGCWTRPNNLGSWVCLTITHTVWGPTWNFGLRRFPSLPMLSEDIVGRRPGQLPIYNTKRTNMLLKLTWDFKLVGWFEPQMRMHGPINCQRNRVIGKNWLLKEWRNSPYRDKGRHWWQCL